MFLGDSQDSRSRRVVSYNTNGSNEELPCLNSGRRSHGCGQYINADNKRVIVIHNAKEDEMLFWQVFLVSGGYEDEDTTELMIEGSSWLEVSSAKLPTSMYLFKIVSFDNKLFATGD